jgi:hypothetical protein
LHAVHNLLLCADSGSRPPRPHSEDSLVVRKAPGARAVHGRASRAVRGGPGKLRLTVRAARSAGRLSGARTNELSSLARFLNDSNIGRVLRGLTENLACLLRPGTARPCLDENAPSTDADRRRLERDCPRAGRGATRGLWRDRAASPPPELPPIGPSSRKIRRRHRGREQCWFRRNLDPLCMCDHGARKTPTPRREASSRRRRRRREGGRSRVEAGTAAASAATEHPAPARPRALFGLLLPSCAFHRGGSFFVGRTERTPSGSSPKSRPPDPIRSHPSRTRPGRAGSFVVVAAHAPAGWSCRREVYATDPLPLPLRRRPRFVRAAVGSCRRTAPPS